MATMPGTVLLFTAWRSAWSTCPSEGLSAGSESAASARKPARPAIEDPAASAVAVQSTSRRLRYSPVMDLSPPLPLLRDGLNIERTDGEGSQAGVLWEVPPFEPN